VFQNVKLKKDKKKKEALWFLNAGQPLLPGEIYRENVGKVAIVESNSGWNVTCEKGGKGSGGGRGRGRGDEIVNEKKSWGLCRSAN